MHNLRHVFLLWNIFLAWIPYILSRYFKQYRASQSWKQAFLFGSWLLFFPNALYIVTDLIHVQDDPAAPVWFDAILLFTCSLLGLIMAYVSLYNVERYLQYKFNRKTISLLMPMIIFLGSFGVYLGRFERWNSWDIIHNPMGLGTDMLNCFISPGDNLRNWGITGILTILFYIIYGFSKIVSCHFTSMKNAGS
jgi:uncharacterized membrane protein